VKVPFLIIGGGLSGLAAAIRFARYLPDVLLIEKHTRLGGLNSYYYRNRVLLETGLHAITNYSPENQKHAPLNKLFRQLKLSRKNFEIYPQLSSEIHFSGQNNLIFSNDFGVLQLEIADKFPSCRDGFSRLVKEIDHYDPFLAAPFRSAKSFIFQCLKDELLTDMLLCPLMFYGSSIENDMDLSQFVIMFRSIFQEGMFRPAGTMQSFLDDLHRHYTGLGGKLLLNREVKRIRHHGHKVEGVELNDGDFIECDYLLSTIGLSETYALLQKSDPCETEIRLGFVESIFLLDKEKHRMPADKTIIFFNQNEQFNYGRPKEPVDFGSGVICFPANFQGRPEQEYFEVRSTHLANYRQWKEIATDRDRYVGTKSATALSSSIALEKIIGNFRQHVVYQDTFTPLTIHKFTAKKEGAIYGCPSKVKDGDIGFSNLFLAGTDQGFLGIIGSMLSGVSMVNKHILPQM
jgi:phytoene dehydrogenase-like protein